MSFENFHFSEELNRAISDLGFKTPSEIQAKAIPVLKKYRGDFVGQAQTGTGKTAAFVLPLLEKIDADASNVQAMVLAPTRELANQVYEEILKLSKYTAIETAVVYGGVAYDKQIRALKGSRPQIVVGTPGRLIDLMDRKVLKLGSCSHLVIDEADEMLNMGFIEDVQNIIESLSEEKTMWMFSATMPKAIRRMIEKKFNRPKMVEVERKTLSNSDIEQFYFVAKRRHFPDALQRILNSTDCYGIVFCETREETKVLSEHLLNKGVNAVALHGELNQGQRDAAMKRFRERQVDLMICTDVAARGIDVQNITHVFNMGLPRSEESYVHRIGRTGRAGTKGTAISFVQPDGMRKLARVEQLCGQKMQALKLPEPKLIKRRKVSLALEKMAGLRRALTDSEEEFRIDPSFKQFKSYFEDLSKEETLKLLFSHQFNKEMRMIDETEHLDVQFTDGHIKSFGGGGGGRGDRRRHKSKRRGNFRRSEKSDRMRRSRKKRR